MSTAKDLLNSRRMKDLRTWWLSVLNNDKFDEIKLLARSEFLDLNPPPNAEALQGAMNFERILETLPRPDDAGDDVLSHISPGIHHDLDIQQQPDKKKG